MGVNAEPRKPALARLAYISAAGLIRTADRPDAALVEMSTAGSGCGKDLSANHKVVCNCRHDVDHLLELCRREFGRDLQNGAGCGNRQPGCHGRGRHAVVGGLFCPCATRRDFISTRVE